MADPTERRRAVSGSERSTRTIVKRVLSASIVIVVLALVAIGSGRVANSGPDETLAVPGSAAAVMPTATPTPTATPSPIPLEDVSFVDAATGHETPLPRSIRSIPTATQFAGSPDGRRFAFAAGGAIYIARTNGSTVHRIATVLGARAPSWSPDGERIVFNDSDRSTSWTGATAGSSASPPARPDLPPQLQSGRTDGPVHDGLQGRPRPMDCARRRRSARAVPAPHHAAHQRRVRVLSVRTAASPIGARNTTAWTSRT